MFGKQICDAISDYYNGNYQNVVKYLSPIRNQIWMIGGSNAQVEKILLNYLFNLLKKENNF